MKSGNQKDIAFQEDEVEPNEIITTTPETVAYEDISSNGSDNENNNDDFDDENNDDNGVDADSEGDFEYSTSTDEEAHDEEEDQCDDSLWLGVLQLLWLLPPSNCSAIISASFEERADPDGYNWANLSNDTRLLYWEEFQKKCCWDDAITSKVKTAWETKAKEKYGQYTYKMRTDKRNKTGKKPSHISSEVWVSWKAKWNTEEFKMKSDQNKKNRRKGVADGPALSTHTGGSASHLKIASDLKKLYGRDPKRSELFLYTHTKNHDGTSFLHKKDEKIHNEFKERCEELEALGEEFDEDQVFYEAVGGHDRKRRLYGFGTYGKAIAPNKGSTETCYMPDNNVSVAVIGEGM
ncbi:hypothetical protein L1887_35429 [Cichorium endivia]|nr:hypothetical protein L1887_35429 [Cichorium endivia]